MSNPDKLPADIAAAIEALEEWFREDGTGDSEYGSTRAALEAAILARLTALEAEIAGLRGSHECVEQHLEDVCAENERLRAALARVGPIHDQIVYAVRQHHGQSKPGLENGIEIAASHLLDVARAPVSSG